MNVVSKSGMLLKKSDLVEMLSVVLRELDNELEIENFNYSLLDPGEMFYADEAPDLSDIELIGELGDIREIFASLDIAPPSLVAKKLAVLLLYISQGI